jgi:hypothetical protein
MMFKLDVSRALLFACPGIVLKCTLTKIGSFYLACGRCGARTKRKPDGCEPIALLGVHRPDNCDPARRPASFLWIKAIC